MTLSVFGEGPYRIALPVSVWMHLQMSAFNGSTDVAFYLKYCFIKPYFFLHTY